MAESASWWCDRCRTLIPLPETAPAQDVIDAHKLTCVVLAFRRGKAGAA